MIKTINRQIPRQAKAYQEADTTADTSAAQTREAVSKLLSPASSAPGSNPLADIYKANIETGLNRSDAARASEAADATNRLRQQKIEVKQARKGDVQAARQTYNSQLKTIGKQLVALGGEKGAYQAAQIDQMLTDAQKNAQARRREARDRKFDWKKTTYTQAQQNARQEDAQAARAEADKGEKVGGREKATNEQLRTFQSDLGQALSWAKQYERAGHSKASARTILTRGATATKTTKGVPKIGDQLAIDLALAQAYGGKVPLALALRVKRQRGIRTYRQLSGISKRAPVTNAYGGRPHDSQQ